MKYFLIMLCFFLAIISCGTKKNDTKTINSQTTVSEPKRVLDSIILVAKKVSLYRKSVNWEVLEKDVHDQFIDSDSITSIIKPVQYLLTQLGDYHGTLFLNGQHFNGNVTRTRKVSYDYQGQGYINQMSKIYQKTLNQNKINAAITNKNIAYIEIPIIMPYGGDDNDIMTNTLKIREKICELNAKKPAGWIIDLRGNLGGNINPMLMGLAELFPQKMEMGGDSYDGKSIDQKWKLEDGTFYYGEGYSPNIPAPNCQSKNLDKNIAVLIGRYTASSGEAVASALKGQDNIKLFGEQTSGATTSNSWIPIGKETVFNPAISYYVSKDETVHKDGITPDIEINENFDFENPMSGEVFEEAVKWIRTDRNSVYKK